MTSQSLVDLVARLDEVRLLTGTDPARIGDVSQPDFGNALNRSCYVLLAAHLEGFLEDLVTEALDSLVVHGAIVDDLPLLLRALHVEHHLVPLEPIKDRNARAPRIEKMVVSQVPMWTTGNSLTATTLNANLVCGQMSNPGSREITQFLELVGVDIKAHLAAVGASDTLGKVNGLVAKRNQIAHGDAGIGASFGDIDSYLQVVAELASHVDVAVAEAVRTSCHLSIPPW